MLFLNKELSRNKFVRIDEVVLCNNEAKNTGIAKATARLFNEDSVQKNKFKWQSYFCTTPKLKISILLYTIIILVVFSGCNISKHLDKNQKLLIENKISTTNSTIPSSDLLGYIQQNDNKKFLLFFNMNVWAFSKNKKGNARPKWLRSIAAERPSILSIEDIETSEKQIKGYLANRGYFNADVSHSISYRGKTKQRATVSYKVETNTPYRIKAIKQNIEDPTIDSIISASAVHSSIKVGDIYDYYKLEKQRNSISTLLRNNGFYYFSQDFIFFEVDSSFNSNELDYTLNIRNNYKLTNNDSTLMSDTYYKQYKIGDIFINPQYDPLFPNQKSKDTIVCNKVIGKTKTDTADYFFTYNSKQLIRPKALLTSTYLESGSIFIEYDASRTRQQLLGLPITRYVNLEFVPKDTIVDGKFGLLDCNINISRGDRQRFGIEGEGTNNDGALGLSGSLIYSNRNVFRGSELLTATVKASAEMQNSLGNTEQNKLLFFNTIETGIELSLMFPRFLGPIKQHRFSKYFRPTSTITTGFNNQLRPDYNRLIIQANLGWNWKKNSKVTHIIKPIELNMVQIDKSEAFEKYLLSLNNPRMYEQYSNHFIMDINYTYIYNSQSQRKNRNFSFFKGSFESAGNLLSLIDNTFNLPKTSDGYYTLFNIRYAQYLKGDVDYRRYLITGKETMVVLRGMIGVGVPYGNAEALPFEKGYYAGGSNGMRGWEIYKLGPGGVNAKDYGNFERIGDIKLEFNFEYRFPIYNYFKGAMFVDAGNIWLMHDDDDFVGGTFKFDQFYNQIALDCGFGIRLDFEYFLIRFDPAIKIFNPGEAVGDRWISNKIQLQDILLNFGIGYPF